jgi:hypothetical protein
MLRIARAVALLSASITLSAVATPAAAQQRLRPASFDLGVGINLGGGGGERNARNGPAASVVLAWQLGGRSTRGMIAGLGASVQRSDPFNEDCIIQLGSSSDCMPDYPGFYAAALLGGWQSGRAGAGEGLRALLGPAIIQGVTDVVGGRNRYTTVGGLQARADYAAPVIPRVAVLASVQGTLVPSLHGERYYMTTFGIGLRLH